MAPHERQYLRDYLASGLAVMKQIERVRGRGVIRERHGQIARHRRGQETIERVVQMRTLVLTRPRDEQRDIRREVGD
jgi:hypothetical protein